MIASLALGKSYHWPSASASKHVKRNMGKQFTRIDQRLYMTITKQSKRKTCSYWIGNRNVSWLICYAVNQSGQDKMAAFLRSFRKSFSCMKIVLFWFKFYWNLFPRVPSVRLQHRLRRWLDTDQATSHYMNQWWHSFIYPYMPHLASTS